jgi:hypothetical protein
VIWGRFSVIQRFLLAIPNWVARCLTVRVHNNLRCHERVLMNRDLTNREGGIHNAQVLGIQAANDALSKT